MTHLIGGAAIDIAFNVVHGTEDWPNVDGAKAYDGVRARLLTNESAADAKLNAENWGFFIEELGA